MAVRFNLPTSSSRLPPNIIYLFRVMQPIHSTTLAYIIRHIVNACKPWSSLIGQQVIYSVVTSVVLLVVNDRAVYVRQDFHCLDETTTTHEECDEALMWAWSQQTPWHTNAIMTCFNLSKLSCLTQVRLSTHVGDSHWLLLNRRTGQAHGTRDFFFCVARKM